MKKILMKLSRCRNLKTFYASIQCLGSVNKRTSEILDVFFVALVITLSFLFETVVTIEQRPMLKDALQY